MKRIPLAHPSPAMARERVRNHDTRRRSEERQYQWYHNLIQVVQKKIKTHIITTGPAMNKTFLMSREKFLGYATTKFGNDVTYSLSKRRIALMHIKSPPTAMDYATTSLHEQRQHEVEAKEFRAEFKKLQNDVGKVYGILWDQCDSRRKNKMQSDVDYADVSKMLNVLGLLTIIERICLSNDTSKYYTLQAFIAEKRLLKFR